MRGFTHTEPPLSFSDQCGYTIVCLDCTVGDGVERTLVADVTENIGFMQPGWFLSLFRKPVSTRRTFVGWYVWEEDGRRVPFNLETALVKMQRRMS